MKSDSAPVFGVSSLLTILAAVCLTVFALLSLSTVYAGSRLSKKNAEAVQQYYAADCEAQKTLAQLRSGETPQHGVYSYACPISETQTLLVQVRLSGSDYQILQWQAAPAADWQADDSLPVWNGETP